MPGYPRPAPAVRWYNWWSNVALMDAERDDDALLEAEDEAIRAAAAGPQPDPADLTTLLEALRGSEDAPVVAEQDRGDGRGESRPAGREPA